MSERQSMNVGDIVLAGFKICSDRWKDLLRVTAMTVLPAAIFGALLIATYTPNIILDALTDPTIDPDTTDQALRALPSSTWVSLGIAVAIYSIGGIIANVVALNACIFIALDHHEGLDRHDAKGITHNEALRAGFSKMWSMLWLTLLTAVLIVIGLLFLILPGIWLFVSWSVAPVVLIREGVKGRKAMGRSFRLVKSAFWLALVVLILEFVCLFVLQAITGSFPGLLLPATAEANSFAVFFTLSLGGALVGLLGVALHAAITTELYFALTAQETVPDATRPGTEASGELADNEVDRFRQ